LVALIVVAVALTIGQTGIGSAQAASTVTVAPASPTGTSVSAPFGFGSQTTSPWGPYTAFVYKNIPPFSLKPGDTISFDLHSPNDVDIQLQIEMTPTTINGGDVTAGPATQIVPNTQVPANPRGDATDGDYELTFTSQAAFNFAGGGLVISFSNPGGAFASDADGPGSGVQTNNAHASDSSGFFVERLLRDANGAAPWDDPTNYDFVAGFRLTIFDVPPMPTPTAPASPTPTATGPTGLRAAALKKCKKKHGRARAKCKKKANGLPV
jgi:hypothetical protein